MPANIEEILNSKAPFLLEDERSCRRVRDNHLLTLIPGKVGGGAFTLDKLGDLALRHFPENNKNDEGKHTHGYRYYSRCLAHQNRKVPLSEEAYWLLLPKTILADSRGKKFSAQNTMVMVYSDSGYQLPHALEVATSLLSHYVRSKECLYGNVPWTYTRCSDQDKNGNPLVVGGLSSSGLYIYDDRYDFSGIGVSCCWKL